MFTQVCIRTSLDVSDLQTRMNLTLVDLIAAGHKIVAVHIRPPAVFGNPYLGTIIYKTAPEYDPTQDA
jgi:hypothetical protein